MLNHSLEKIAETRISESIMAGFSEMGSMKETAELFSLFIPDSQMNYGCLLGCACD